MLDNNEIWPPPPVQQVCPQTSSETDLPKPSTGLNVLCFVIALVGSWFSWGVLTLPILLIAVLVTLWAKSPTAKSAAKSAAWGAGIVLLLLAIVTIINCVSIPW